jgi:sulfur-oxidizing protein SoxZ
MADMSELEARALIRVPARARRGEIVEIRTMVSHPMETGYRPGADGQLVPRDIIREMVCTYDGQTVFRADLFPAVSANPYLIFDLVATRSGEVLFRWTDDRGRSMTRSARIEVE